MADRKTSARHAWLLAALLAAPLVLGGTVAKAAGHGGGRHDRGQASGPREWNNGPHGPDRRGEARNERGWDDQGRHEGYYHRPDLYYSAPPVVVVHPDYYRQPASLFNLRVPFFYR
jgi:hypothetical protein